MGQCGSNAPKDNIDDVQVIWSGVLPLDDGKRCFSVDLVYQDEARLNYKKRHKYRKNFQRLMTKIENHVTLRSDEVHTFDQPINMCKTLTAKSSEHLDFNEMLDTKANSKRKITPDFDSDSSDGENEHEIDQDTTMSKTIFDSSESHSFIPVHELPFKEIRKQTRNINHQETVLVSDKNVEHFDVQRLRNGTSSPPDLSAKHVIHRFYSKTTNMCIDSGYLSVHTHDNLSSKEVPCQILKHVKEFDKRSTPNLGNYQPIENETEKCQFDEHTFENVSERSCPRKFYPTDGLTKFYEEKTISKRTRKAFVDHYTKLLKDFFTKHNLQKEGVKSYPLTEYYYIKKFDEYLEHDFSLSSLGESEKEDVFKLLSIGVELARYDREYVAYPTDGLQKYFEEMSVPIASRPPHAETMRYEWVRVRSFWSFPSNIRVSPLAMARVGFYYTGKSAECRCFCCGAVHREWRDGDDPYVIHQQISPNCLYLNGQESGNVSIHEEDRLQPRRHVDHTHVSNTIPPRTQAEAIVLPGLSSAEIASIPVPTATGQGRSLGTSQNGDFKFRPQNSQTGSTTPASLVFQGQESSGFTQPLQCNQNVDQSAFTLQSSGEGTSIPQSQANVSSYPTPSTQGQVQFGIFSQGSESGVSRETTAPRSLSVSPANSQLPTLASQLPTFNVSTASIATTCTLTTSIVSASALTQPPPANFMSESTQSSNPVSWLSGSSTAISGTESTGLTNQQASITNLNSTASTSSVSHQESTSNTSCGTAESSRQPTTNLTSGSALTGSTINPTSAANEAVSSTSTSFTANTTSSTTEPPTVTTTSDATLTTGASSNAVASSNTTVGAEPSRSQFDPLGINFEKPRYPAYAVLTLRINTYSGWPSYLDQLIPRMMAKAGFFYAGYGDYTRCFFCGGGLRNWEASDDPWVEHARWFPKCAFLRQNRGDNFVNMVQTRHQEAESTNQPIVLPRQQSVLDEGRPTNIMGSIPVQTLREMGKDDAIITEALEGWRATQQEAGQTSNYTELQATEIYEIILQIENERELSSSSRQQTSLVQQSGTSLTTGHQQSLEQQSVIPQSISREVAQLRDQQSTGGTNDQLTGAEGTSEQLPAYLEGFDKVLEEFEEQKERLTCKICIENPVAIAFLPCGHLVCCLDCAPAMRKCPVCHEFVKGTIKTFFP